MKNVKQKKGKVVHKTLLSILLKTRKTNTKIFTEMLLDYRNYTEF